MSFLKSFFKSVTVSFIVAGTLTTLVGGTVYSRVEGTTVDLNKLRIDASPTVIYDKNNNIMAQFKKERKDVTEYKEIPQEIIDAVLSTEDRAFYDHPGINVKGISRAAIKNAASGGFGEGGSTLTQQLIKRIYLTDEKSLDRKLKEAILATTLEGELSKEEILTSYLNHIFYGNNAYGISRAVETYYGQSLDEFKKDNRIDRIAKAALLGGLPQLPTEYNPYVNPDKAKTRREAVLLNMLNQKKITKDEYEQAKAKTFEILKEPNIVHDDEKIYYGEVVYYALNEAAKVLGTDFEGAKYSGKKIYTSFDPQAYEIVRKHFDDNSLFPSNASDGTKVEGSATFVNPKTGEIYALTGGRQKPNIYELNRAFQGKRQPGSSFKPIIDYGPALESGKFTPNSVLPDVAGMSFGGYAPRNFGGKAYGSLQMIDALKLSENIPAVYLLSKVGIPYATEYAKRLGIELDEKDRYLPIALGGITNGVSTLQMADAYQAYANGGHRVPAHIIKRMVASNGDITYEADNKLTNQNQVIKPTTASSMRYMLRNAVEHGTGTNAQIPGEIVAGKTGTTDSNNDIWFTGFTTEFTGSIWMGFDNAGSNHKMGVTSYVAAKMFGEIGKDLAKLYPDGDGNFKLPDGTEEAKNDIQLSANYNENQKVVSLSWNSKKYSSYKVYRNDEVIADNVSSTSYTDSNIQDNKRYTYKVVAIDKSTDFEMSQSNVVSIETKTHEKLVSPSLQATDVGEDSITINWNKADHATSYLVTIDGKTAYVGSNLSYTAKGLSSGTTYEFKIMAQNEDGKGDASVLRIATKSRTVQQPVKEEPKQEEQDTSTSQPTDETKQDEQKPEDKTDLNQQPTKPTTENKPTQSTDSAQTTLSSPQPPSEVEVAPIQ